MTRKRKPKDANAPDANAPDANAPDANAPDAPTPPQPPPQPEEPIAQPERLAPPPPPKEEEEKPQRKEIPLPKEGKKLTGKKIVDFSSIEWQTADDFEEIKAGIGEVTGLKDKYLETATKAAAPALYRLSRMIPGTGSDAGLVANIVVAVVVVGGCYAAQNFSNWFDPEKKKTLGKNKEGEGDA